MNLNLIHRPAFFVRLVVFSQSPQNLSALFFGGILMGLGAGLSKGTFTPNGLVYNAILSTQSWLALLFTVIGCWSASFVLYIVKKSN